MRDLTLIKPTGYTINQGLFNSRQGVFEIENSSSDNPKFYLQKEGETYNKYLDSFKIKIETSKSGGKSFVRKRPSQFGYMPHHTSEPMKWYITDQDSPTQTDWWGQSSLGVKKYKKFLLDTQNDDFPFEYDDSGRLFSWDGNLFYLCEFWDATVDNYSQTVHLYAYIESLEKFILVKIFDEVPVDTEEAKTDRQLGSPDWFVYEDNLHIGYRVFDRNEQVNQIVIYETEDLSSWEQKNIFDIKDLPTEEFNDFRLRFSSNDSSIMMVFYALCENTIDDFAPARTVYYNDMRSYVSFDGGYSFRTKNKSFSNVRLNNRNSYEKVRTTTSLHHHFITDFINGTYWESVSGWNVTFDLYFDKDLQSYVILKGGEPTVNDDYLIGIKTTDDSHLDWEICLKTRVGIPLNGNVQYIAAVGFDPWNEVRDDPERNAYRIKDLVVVQGEDKNYLVTKCFSTNDVHYSLNEHSGAAVSTFRFVRDENIPPGFYDSVYAYGGKYHEEISWISSPINPDWNGPLSTGNPTEIKGVQEPIACLHNNELVYSVKITDNAQTGYKFLCYAQPWENVGEKYGYNFSYTAYYRDFDKFGLADQTTGGASVSADGEKVRCDIASASEEAYLLMDASSTFGTVSHPNILDRGGLSAPYFFKARFEMRVDFLQNGMVVFQCEVGDTDAMTIDLELNSGGGLIAKTLAGAALFSTASAVFVPGEYSEVLVGIGRGPDDSVRAFLWHRGEGETKWIYGGHSSISTETASSNYMKIGAVSGASSGQIVDVKTLQLSTYQKGYRRTFVDYKRDYEIETEGCSNYKNTATDNDNIVAEPSLGYNSLVAYDGFRFDIDGYGDVAGEYDCSISRKRGRNSIYNIGMETSQYGYQFKANQNQIFIDSIETDIDAISLINLFGVWGFKLKSGTYDAGTSTWTTSNEQEYTVPYEVLDVSSISGKFITLNTEQFEDREILDHNIIVYNTSTSVYEEQFFVKRQYGNIIEVDSNLPSTTDREFRVFVHGGSWDIPTALQDHTVDDFMVELYLPNTFTFAHIGVLTLGSVVDLTDIFSEMNMSEVGSSVINENERGFLYHSRPYEGPDITRIDLTANQVLEKEKMESLFFELYDKDSFILVAGNDNGVQSWNVSPVDSLNISPDAFHDQVSLTFEAKDYTLRLSDLFKDEPDLTIQVEPQTIQASGSVNFSADGSDPDGEAVTYSWDFGDGGTSTLQSGNYSYASEGEYTVECVATNASGESVTSTTSVFVLKPLVTTLDVTWTGGTTPSVGSTEQLTVQFQDSSGNNITYDNKTRVTLTPVGDIEVDGDGDGVFDEAEDFDKVVQNGEAVFDFKGTSVGTHAIIVSTGLGVSTTIQIEFV